MSAIFRNGPGSKTRTKLAKTTPMLAETGRNAVEVCRTLDSFGRNQPRTGQNLTHLAKHNPTSVDISANSAEVGRSWSNMARFWRKLANGSKPEIVGRAWPKFVRIRPNNTQLWPNSALAETNQTWSKRALEVGRAQPKRVDLAPNSAEPSQTPEGGNAQGRGRRFVHTFPALGA